MDLIRVLAAIAVIVVHTKHYFVSAEVHFSTYAVLSILGSIGVPLFVILTGYLMLNRDYEDNSYLKMYLTKNLLPLFVAFEFWNIAWNIFRHAPLVEPPQPWLNIIKAALFAGDTFSALWYLPMAVALYLGIPIIAIIYRRITLPLYQKILFFSLLLSGTVIPSAAFIIQSINGGTDIHSVLRMNIFGASVWGESVWMIYLFAGYAIYKGKLKTIKSSVLFIFGVIFTIIVMYFISKLMDIAIVAQHYDFILFVLLSISMFELLTRTEKLLQSCISFQAVIHSISRISFAVYMLHIFIGGFIALLWRTFGINTAIGQMFSNSATIILYLLYLASIIFITKMIVCLFQKSLFIRRYIFLMK